MKVNVEESIPVVECMRKFLYVTHVKYREFFGVNLKDCGRGAGRRESSGIDFEANRCRPNRSRAIFAKRERCLDMKADKRLLQNSDLGRKGRSGSNALGL
jgi:hypothetical protein